MTYLKYHSLILASGLALAGAPSFADQQILDDLIVVGSACVGQDCVNGESFGFDTLRLKENNLRIKFQDTSVSASFPSNDWQITANDSSNGGANYLRFDDITNNRQPFTVEAGAQNHTLYVEADGDVGIKTSNPAVDLHIVEGNTPTMRLEQDGSDGFTPQIWDVAGNETNFFIRDVTNGSRLSFRIKPGAPQNSMFIDAAGRIGMGTDSPNTASNLHIVDTDGRTEIWLDDGSVGDDLRLQLNGDDFNISFDATGGAELQIQKTGVVQIRRGPLGLASLAAAPTGTDGMGGVIYVDAADGDLKVRFQNGTVATLATN